MQAGGIYVLDRRIVKKLGHQGAVARRTMAFLHAVHRDIRDGRATV
jgi:hypothetical protein